jgi:hypothetical protein
MRTEPTIHEIRNADDARAFALFGVPPARQRLALEWALEIASAGQPLPPAAFVADLGFAALGQEREDRQVREAMGLPAGLARAYEDHVLGKLYADATFERAGDALRRYQGRDQARGLAFIAGQIRERTPFDGVLLSPAVLKALLSDSPDPASRERKRPEELIQSLYGSLIAAFRQAAELLGPEDLFELEHGTALQELGERLALRQVLQAADLLERALPRHRPRPRPGRREVPTRVLDEDTYPVGGFASLSTRGSVESLLHSQLAFMEKADRPDLFDLKYLRDELLYYSRDENQFLRRRQTFVFALWPDLVEARFKDVALPYQRGILVLGWLVAAVRKLLDWLSADALTFVLAFVGDSSGALEPERALLELVLREQIANGTVTVQSPAHVRQLERWCLEQTRRSLVRCLTTSTADRPLTVEAAEVARLQVAGAAPVLRGIDQVDGSGDPPPTAMEQWAATLHAVLAAWV